MRAYNSTIQIKPCRCGCGKPKKLGLEGYATLNCMPSELREKSKYNTKNTLARSNKAKIRQIERMLHKDRADSQNANSKPENNPQGQQIWDWFVERRIDMQDCCIECGKSTQKKNIDN